MAEKKLVDKLTKYSKATKNKDFYNGEKETNIFERLTRQTEYNGRYTEFGGIGITDLKKKVINALQSDDFKNYVNNISQLKEQIDLAKNSGFLKPEFLETLGRKELKRVCKFLSKVGALCKNYKDKEKILNSPFAVGTKLKYAQAFDCYSSVISKINTNMHDLSDLNTFDTDAFAKAIEMPYKTYDGNTLDSNLNIAHNRDLEVVRALEYIGINLKREKVNGQTLWVVDQEKTKNNHNGLSFVGVDGKPVYKKLTYESVDSQIQSFLNEYLNKDISKRNGAVITPEGIFQLYLEESTTDLKMLMGHAFGLGREDNKAMNEAIENAKQKFSTKSKDWQAFMAEGERLTVCDASKLALIDLFKDNLREKEDVIDSDLQDIIQSNNLINSRSVNNLVDSADRFNMLADSQREDKYSAGDNIVRKYIAQKEYLEDKLKENLDNKERTQLQSRLATIEDNINALQLVREFEYNVVKEIVKDTTFENDEYYKNFCVETINNLSECDFLRIEKTGDTYNIITNESIKMLDSHMQKVCENVISGMRESLTKDTSSDKTKTPEKDKDEKSSDEKDKDIEETSHEHYTDVVFSDSELFVNILDATTNNPDNNLAGNAMCADATLEMTESVINSGNDNEINHVINAYRTFCKEHPDDQKTITEFIDELENINGTKEIFLPVADKESIAIVEALTRDNSKEYMESDDYKNALAKKQKINNNATTYFVMIDRIKNRLFAKYPDLTRENLTKEMINNEYNQILGEGPIKPTPEELKAVEKYRNIYKKLHLQNVMEGMELNGTDKTKLAEDVAKIADSVFEKDEIEKDKESDAEKEEAPKTMKFSEKYPKNKEAELLKKFKPYCAKSTVKIIEKMLKMIEDCDILAPVDKNANKEPLKTGVPEKDTTKDTDEPEKTGDEPEKDDKDASEWKDKPKEPEKDEDATDTEKHDEEPEPKKDEEQKDAEKTSEPKKESVFADENQIGIPDKEFATYKILGVGLQAVLKAKSFEKNRSLLSSDEKARLSSLSNVLNYITSMPKDEEEKKLKNFLAYEIDYKSRTSDANYAKDRMENNKYFYSSEFKDHYTEIFDDINNVMNNMHNIDELGAIIGITTDRSKEGDNGIGNTLQAEDITQIAKCKNASELWMCIRKNKQLYDNGLWQVPGLVSSKLNEMLRQAYELESKTIDELEKAELSDDDGRDI